MTLIMLLPINHIVYAQQTITNGVVKRSAVLKIGNSTFPINYSIKESRVFGNYTIAGPVRVGQDLLGNITHIDAVRSNSTLIITTNSSIGIALTVEIPRSVNTVLTNNISPEGGNQKKYPVSINGQQIFALICPKDDVTKVFIPSISNNAQNITINLSPTIFKASSLQTCNRVT